MSHHHEARIRELLSLCRTRGLSIGSAESLTGGLLGSAVTAVPGASDVYRGGVVAYSTEVKTSVLHVSSEALGHGIVSENVAVAMAQGVQRLLPVDLALSCTGVAGPGPQDGVSEGTVWICVASDYRYSSSLLSLKGSRQEIRDSTVEHLIALAIAFLLEVS